MRIKLVGYLTDIPLFQVVVQDHHLEQLTIQCPSMIENIWPSSEHHYQGLERRLQYFLDTQEDLPTLLSHLDKEHPFFTPVHVELKLLAYPLERKSAHDNE